MSIGRIILQGAAVLCCLLAVPVARAQTNEELVNEIVDESCTPEDCVPGFPVTSISTLSASAGSPVVITAPDVSRVTQVSFDGNVPAQFTIDSPTQITAIVPEGANNSNIVLDFPGGAYVTDPFTRLVGVVPAITSVSPPATFIGYSADITGSGFTFNGAPAVTSVAFVNSYSNYPAGWTVLSDTQLSVAINSNTGTGVFNVKVCTAGGCATSTETISLEPVISPLP